jgi:hypothetical protein
MNYYNNKNHLYLVNNMRLKRKVDINYRAETHEWELSGLGWRRFIDESGYMNIRTLHFIKEGDDTFYVTAYEEDGGESGGMQLYIQGIGWLDAQV